MREVSVSFKIFFGHDTLLVVGGWFIFKRLSVERYFARWSLGYEAEEIRNPVDIRRRVNEARYSDVHEERKTADGGRGSHLTLLYGRGAIFYIESVTGI